MNNLCVHCNLSGCQLYSLYCPGLDALNIYFVVVHGFTVTVAFKMLSLQEIGAIRYCGCAYCFTKPFRTRPLRRMSRVLFLTSCRTFYLTNTITVAQSLSLIFWLSPGWTQLFTISIIHIFYEQSLSPRTHNLFYGQHLHGNTAIILANTFLLLTARTRMQWLDESVHMTG